MSSFITAGKEGMNQYAKDNNIELVWNSANLDVSTQANQVDSLINQGVNAIIVVPVQADSLGPQVASAKARASRWFPSTPRWTAPTSRATCSRTTWLRVRRRCR
jgi:ribose transport system substrate-binding protein